MTKQTWENLGAKFIPTSALSEKLNASEDGDKYEKIIEKSSQIENVNSLMSSYNMIFNLLILAAITLAVVILYNLGALNYTEKIREYATLKVLGYHNKEIANLALKENLITTTVGILIGLPLGFAFIRIYIGIVSVDNFEWLSKLEIKSLTIAIVITVICSFGVNLLLGLKIRKIKMAESLKSVE